MSEHSEKYPDYKKPPWDREVDAPVILKAMAVLTLVTVVAFVGMWWLFLGLRNAEAAKDPAPSPFADAPRAEPLPRLQEFPPTDDIERLRGGEAALVEGYGEGTAGDGSAQYRLPVDRAIEILAERGLGGSGDVENLSEEIFGDTASAATSAEVTEPAPEGQGSGNGGHE
jgi:hypothetical protein